MPKLQHRAIQFELRKLGINSIKPNTVKARLIANGFDPGPMLVTR